MSLAELALSDLEVDTARQELLNTIVEEARVVNPETGYILWKGGNRMIQPQTFVTFAAVTKHDFVDRLPEEDRPTKVAGISSKGRDYAPVLGVVLEIPTLSSDEREAQPDEGNGIPEAIYDSEEDVMFIKNVKSFTKGKFFTHKINCLRPGDSVIFTDDWCAYGTVALALKEALEKVGVKVSFAILAAKDLAEIGQQGYRRMKQDGVNIHAVIRVTGMEGDRVIATTEDLPLAA